MRLFFLPAFLDSTGRDPALDHRPLLGYVRRWANVNAAAACVLLLAGLSGASEAAASQRLLVLGDSLTAGYGLKAENGFTAQLQAALKAAGRDAAVLNAGVSGDTTAGGKARIGWALADKPDAVILELGANDGLRGLDPKATFDNLDAVIAKVKAAGLPLLLTGMVARPIWAVNTRATSMRSIRAWRKSTASPSTRSSWPAWRLSRT
jgi:hypothetical protein